MEDSRNKYLTLEEVCVEARSGYGKVWRAVRSGELQSLRAGRRVLVPVAAVRGWLARVPAHSGSNSGR